MADAVERPNSESPSDQGRGGSQATTPSRFRFSLRTMLLVMLVVAFLTGGYWNWVVISGRRRAEASSCEGNVKYIGVALHNYHDTYHRFPPAITRDAAGTPLCSWRSMLLPYLTYDSLHYRYRLDERWDSQHNRQFTNREYSFYRCPSCKSAEHARLTNYVCVIGKGTAFPPDGKAVRFNDIIDGAAHTILFVETLSDGIHWAEPRDLRFDNMSFEINDKSKPSISSPHSEGPAVFFVDGQVNRLNPNIRPDTLKALLTIAGGEPIDRDKLIAEGILR